MEIIKSLYLRLPEIKKAEDILIKIVVVLLIVWLISYDSHIYANAPLFINGSVLIFYGFVLWFLVGLFFTLNIVKITLWSIYKEYDKTIIVHWISYIVLIISLSYYFYGYRIAYIGFNALFNGLDNTAMQAHYLLLKLYPENIITSLYSLIFIFNKPISLFQYNELIINYYILLPCFIILFFGVLFLNIKMHFTQRVKSLNYWLLFFLFVYIAYLLYSKFYANLTRNEMLVSLYIGQLLLSFIILFWFIVLYSYFKSKALKNTLPLNVNHILFIIIIFLPLLSFFQNKFSYERKIQNLIAKNKLENTMVVTAKKLNVRTAPSIKGKVIAVLNKGELVNVIRIQQGWAMIKKNYWTSMKYLERKKKE